MIAGFSPTRSSPRARPHLVAVIAFDGVVLADLATPCELFAHAKSSDGRRLYDVRVCSATANVSSEHLALQAPWRLQTVKRADTVIIPGMDDIELPVDESLLRVIRAAIDGGARVASICTGAFVLAATGALDGRRATTHWQAASELARRHPKIEVHPDVLYVDNGKLLTSAGAAAAHDLCLHLIRRDFGAAVAAEVARLAVMPLDRVGGQAQFIVHNPPRAEGMSMESLLAWLEQHVAEDMSLEAIARHAAMSKRTLSRHFRQQVGMTPACWIGHARIKQAQRLLETTGLSVERIAEQSGFASSAVFRERFRSIAGTNPLAYRRAFSSNPGFGSQQRSSRP